MGKVNNHTSKSNRTLSKVNHKAEIVESLPRGWKVETRTRESGDRIGKKYKRYIDPVTGGKFYSREEVSRYLKSTQSETHVVIERRDAVDGLPPGWTMELKIRTKGERSRSDPYYKDPLTGYVFRSKKDVVRYLKTGDLGKYAFRPKEGGIHTVEEINGKALPSSTTKEKKVNDNLGNRELFTKCSKSDAAVNDDRILESSSAGGGDKGELRSLSPADTKSSKKATGKKVSVRKGVSRTQPLDKSPSENQVVENGAEENERRNTQNGSRKRNHKIEFDTPRRTSKRLAGIGAEAKLPVMCTTINANKESVTDSQALAVEPPPEAKPNVNSMQINVPNEASHITAVGPCPKANLAVNSAERIDGVSQVATEEPPPDAKLSVNFGESNVGLASVMKIPNQTPQIAAAESCVNSSGINAELASVEHKPDDASQLEALEPPTDPELYANSHVVKETLVMERQHMEPPLEAKLVVTSNTGVWDHQQEPDKSVTGKHPVQQEGYQVYEKLDSLVTLPLGESWSDPCLEFAYKTLTGELPWEDNQPPENNQSSPFPDILPISDPCIEFAYKTLTGEIPVENNPVTPSPIPISDPCIEFAYKTLTGDIPVQDIPSNAIPISDPCLEFAYKTLMGEIPVEDCLSIQGYFQHQPGSSTTKTPSGSNELSDSSLNKLHIQTSGMFRSQNLFGSSNNVVQQHSNRNARMDCSTREVIP
ncbi:hypothetical protein ACHQM5_000754 [Ranunculus cassubicifolius]